MTFSVLICTYNRPDMLRLALAALLDRTTEKPDQVVIVNGADEQTESVVAPYAGQNAVQITLLNIENKNLANSRNAGLPHCFGEIVAMTDDDAEVAPDWVTQHKRLHAEHPEAGAVGGLVIGTQSGTSLLSRLADIVTFPNPGKPTTVRTLPGVNVSYKGSVLKQLGPQDETLFRGEDVDFNWRLQKLGYTVYFDPAISVLHHHRPTLRRFFSQHYMYGRAYYLVRRKWQEMYCVYPHHFDRPKAFLKFIHFFGAAFYEPFLTAWRLPAWADRLRGLPILFMNQIAWRSGIIVQFWRTNRIEK